MTNVVNTIWAKKMADGNVYVVPGGGSSGGGGGGSVTTDATLKGDGTSTAPLGINPPPNDTTRANKRYSLVSLFDSSGNFTAFAWEEVTTP